MFKKPKRNFRSRQRDSESDEENKAKDDDVKNKSQTETGSPPSSTGIGNQTKKKKVIPKVPSTNTILSFEQDEDADGEVFQVKKSSHSRRVVKQLKKETLREKQELPSVKSEAAVIAECQNGSSVAAAAYEATQVKKEAVEEDEVVVNDCNDDSYEDDEDDDEDGSFSARKASGPSVQDILKSGQIPDANLIHFVRKRRQQAREMGDDFIPIDDAAKSVGKSSRLIRDDENDASDSDGENFALTSVQKEADRRRLRETILAAEEESHSEASDHEREWEEQQIRKGVSIPAQPATAVVSGVAADSYFYGSYPPSSTYAYGSQLHLSSSSSSLMGYAVNPVVPVGTCRVPDPASESKPISLETSKEKLMERLSEMMDRHRVHVHERDEMDSRRELNRESIESLARRTSGLEEQYGFFQEMRGYVRDLVECMNEKMSSINFLDRCMMNLWKERAQKLVKRHQEDVKDQSLEYKPVKISGTVPLVADNGPEEQARSRRRTDREGRRNRRKLVREMQGIRDHCDGMSTDDEFSPSEITKFKTDYERQRHSCETALDDVVDDFCQFPLIRRRFEKWKKDYSDSYNEAYISLCLGRLFTPFVKLELITWNPLESNCADFEQSNWFRSLLFYGLNSGSGVSRDDPDVNLLPSIVEKALLPRLKELVDYIWNPLSLKQTHRLVALLKRLVDNYPTVCSDSKPTKVLIESVVSRVKTTLDDDIFMPLYPKPVIENRTSGASIFFHRQFWLCIKLLKSIALWDGIVSERHLQKLAFDGLLNRYLVVALTNVPIGSECLTMCQAVVASIPRNWLLNCKGGDVGTTAVPQLENFCRYLVNTAASVLANKESRDLVRQISGILISLQAMNHVSSLASRANFSILE